MKLITLLVTATILVFALIAILSETKEETIVERMRLPISSMPLTIDPQNMGQVESWNIGKHLTDGLFSLDRGFKLSPVAAESAEWLDDGLTLQIKIKKINFSDGTPLDSSHVVQTIERCAKGAKSLGLSSFRKIVGFEEFESGKSNTISGIDVINPSEVKVRLFEPAGLLITDLAHNGCFLVKPSPNGSIDFLKGAVGVGLYKLGKVDESKIELNLRTDIKPKEIFPKKLEFIVDKSLGDRTLDQLKSQFDVFYQKSLSDDSSYNSSEYSPIGSIQLILNCKSGPFKDKLVREAIYRGFNAQEFFAALSWSIDELQSGLIPFGMAGFKKKEGPPQRDKAKELLAQAGYSNQKPLQFKIYISKNGIHPNEVSAWQKIAFKDLPITVNAEAVNLSEVWTKIEEFDYHAIRATKYPGSLEAHRMLNALQTKSKFNFGAFSNPKCDVLIDAASKETDYDTRISKYAEVDECLMKDYPVLPLTAIPKQYVYIRKPYKFADRGRFLLKPIYYGDWEIEGKK